MNLNVARKELGVPPRIKLQILGLEALGMVALSWLLVELLA
jgi:hypothetical protein